MADPVGNALPSLGVELEMPVIDDTGATGLVDGRYFSALKTRRGGDGQTETLGGHSVAVVSPLAVNGIDNGWNLLETAHAPVPAGRDGLTLLARRIRADMADVTAALATQGLRVTSLAQHPTAGCTPALYRKLVAPKPIYTYLTERRGWNHAVGIDAKAQNGPTTGTRPEKAVAELNMLLAAAPAFIALFANSPFENGRPSGFMETRMTLWPRMVATSNVTADHARVGVPSGWFMSLGEYFSWTFAPGTVMHAVPHDSGSYKGGTTLFEPGNGRMNAAAFFDAAQVQGRAVHNGTYAMISPGPAHFEFLQWSNFLDFRLRFDFAPPGPNARDLARALSNPSEFLPLFRAHVCNMYIENRCCGATFVDADLAARAPRPVQASCMIAPSALQAGLVMAAHDHAVSFGVRWPLETVKRLRWQAIRDGLPGPGSELHNFCSEVLALARRYLPPDDRHHLAYPAWVLETGATGARRAIDQRAGMGAAGAGVTGLQRLARARDAVPPPSTPSTEADRAPYR